MSYDPSPFDAAHALLDPRPARGARPDLPPPLPPPMPTPEPARRARGVYLGKDTVPGTVIVLVYDRHGRRISRAELVEDVYTVACFDAFRAWLDMVDPEPGDAPAPPPLRLV